MRLAARALAAGLAIAACVVACSSSSTTGTPEQTGQSCTLATQCYPGIEAGALKGEVQCMTRVPNGYCTHLCTTDADCCAVPGECHTGFKQVCAPFESTGQSFCFLSCETVDVAAAPNAGTTDTTLYCQKFANSAFSCRSTGGGSANRKVCVP